MQSYALRSKRIQEEALQELAAKGKLAYQRKR